LKNEKELQIPKQEPKNGLITKVCGQIAAKKEKFLTYHLLEFLLFLSTYTPSTIPLINNLYNYLFFRGTKTHQEISYKAFNFDCLFRQYVNEWALPIEKASMAIKSLRKMIEKRNLKVHFPIEIRFVKGDDIWMSPAFGGDMCFIGIIMYRPFGKDPDYHEYFDEYQKLMESLGGRPHWAKIHTWTETQISQSYPKWEDFKNLRAKLDPNKVFWNAYLERIFSKDTELET